LLAFAADAGAFAALRGQDVGMAGVGVARIAELGIFTARYGYLATWELGVRAR
jgi:hypothetical protein